MTEKDFLSLVKYFNESVKREAEHLRTVRPHYYKGFAYADRIWQIAHETFTKLRKFISDESNESKQS